MTLLAFDLNLGTTEFCAVLAFVGFLLMVFMGKVPPLKWLGNKYFQAQFGDEDSKRQVPKQALASRRRLSPPSKQMRRKKRV